MADLVHKDFKTTLLKMLTELKDDIEKVNKIVCEQKGNIIEEIGNLQKNQKKIMELKNTITKTKIHLRNSKVNLNNQ